jgi:hypothetical protein
MTRARVTSGERHDDSDVTQERHLSDSPGSNDSVMRTADEAFDALYKLFTSPEVRRRAHLSCCTDGPTEFDLMFESARDEAFGPDPNSKYKRWIRRLRRHGLIP